MEQLTNVLEASDLSYFASGAYKITLMDFLNLKKDGKAVMLDVRSKEESDLLAFPFMINIPLNELPQRVAELPKDKTIATFCASSFRAVMAYTYLRALGFESVKVFLEKPEDFAGMIMPPYAAKNHESFIK